VKKKQPVKMSASDLKRFNESYPIIKVTIEKQRHRWNLTALNWIDFDDVFQIILIHVYNKWKQFDPERGSLVAWLSVLSNHQISNIIRNLYGNYSRPCLKCEASEDTDGCKIYGKQCDNCPLYAEWKKRKQPAYNLKLPLSIENHTNEIHSIFDENQDISGQVERIHEKMKQILKPLEYKVYEGLFILNEDEEKLAVRLGYISNESGRTPGYKQIKNIRKSIVEKLKKAINSDDIDL
jgi:hypothetical protein